MERASKKVETQVKIQLDRIIMKNNKYFTMLFVIYGKFCPCFVIFYATVLFGKVYRTILK